MTTTIPPHLPALTSCPGCDSALLGDSFFLAEQPVILNYRFASKEAARNVSRRDMELRECPDCGLIFNAILDAAAIPYDERYENRQNFSSGFRAMLEETSRGLTECYGLNGGTVLEVGCGKGDFLHLLCDHARARGLGYDTSYEMTGTQTDSRVSFFQRYVAPVDVTENIDLVVCRHVVEHVPQIGDFFRLLHGIAVAGGNSAVYIETPALEWIVEHKAFWDVFYEHCNYFTMPTLHKLAAQAGFVVLDHRLIFGGQYQALELRPSATEAALPQSNEKRDKVLRALTETFARSQLELTSKLTEAGFANGWAVWGAGAKGVSLANTFLDHPPAYVIDSNPSKQGMFLPGTGISVIAPDDSRVASVPVILVANTNYLSEIRASLAQQGITPLLLSV